MKRTSATLGSAIFGSAIFLVIAPGTLMAFVPWEICRWRLAPPLLGFFPFRIIGALMIATGLAVMLDSFARFAIKGMGTPAPVRPPQHLVVTGLYCYVRNPMYVAGLLLVLGQGLLLVKDMENKIDQVTLLRSAGFEVSDVASMLGMTENHVNVTAHAGRKRQGKKKAKN